jgi:hypothetical protein
MVLPLSRCREDGTAHGLPPQAIRGYHDEHGTAIAIRRAKYLKNLVAQDHRAVTRITRPTLGFKAFAAAQGTLAGVELRQMIRQGPLASGAEQGLTAAERFSSLAASSPAQQGLRHHSAKFAIDPGKIYTRIPRVHLGDSCLHRNDIINMGKLRE